VVAKVLDRFEQVGLVDDAEFARSLVRSRQASRGLAGRALRQELRRSGVDDDTVAAALADIDPEQELATAQALVAKRLPSTRGLPTPKRISRLAGMLARKGYPSGVTMQVVRAALDAEGSADDHDADAADSAVIEALDLSE
jgi:regulatory protein